MTAFNVFCFLMGSWVTGAVFTFVLVQSTMEKGNPLRRTKWLVSAFWPITWLVTCLIAAGVSWVSRNHPSKAIQFRDR